MHAANIGWGRPGSKSPWPACQEVGTDARDPSIGLMQWLDYSESIGALIDDGQITEAELEVLHSELARLQSKLSDGNN